MNIDELRADLLRPKLKPAVGSAKPTVVTTLVGALETHDSGGLSTVLTAVPKDKLKKALTDSKILTALVDNYNPNAHTQLVKKGFDLCFFSEKILFTCIHGPGWSNLLSNTPKTKAFDKWLHHMFQETLDYDFQKRYPMCKNNAAEFRRALQQYDPVLHDQALKVFFKNSEGVQGLMPIDQKELSNLSAQEWGWLKAIAKDSWCNGFQHDFSIEQTELNVFLNFFGELPLAKQALDDIYLQAKTNKSRCMNLLSSSGGDIRTSVLWSKLNNFEQNAFNKNLTLKSKILEQLGLNELDILLYDGISPTIMKTIEQTVSAPDRGCLQYFSNSTLLTNSLSFIHFLVGSVEVETLSHLAKSPKACQKIVEALADPMTLQRFCSSIHISHYKKIFKNFPQLITWRDQYNNTILHHALALNAPKVDEYYASCVMEFVASHPQLREGNNIGVSLRDMCHRADAKMLADYDKKSVSVALKNAGLNGNKKTAVKRKI